MNLNDNERKLLEMLEKDPYQNQQSIADQLSLSRPAVANLISGLQEKGYILGKPYKLRQTDYVMCIGAANMDYSFKATQNLVPKTSNPVVSTISFGGVVRNIAENLARLDMNVSLMTLVGDDTHGEALLNDASQLMHTFATDRLKGEVTGSYYSVLNCDGDMDIGYADMNITSHMDRSWILEHKRHLNLGQWIVCDMNVNHDAVDALIEWSRTNQKKLALIGVSGPKMKNLPKDIASIEVIIVNRDETQSYFQTEETDLEKLCRLWLRKGVRQAVVTGGKEGCAYGNETVVQRQQAFSIEASKIINATGAGDAFSAALVYGLMQHETLERSVQYATSNASLTIQTATTVNRHLSLKEIKKEIERNELK